MRRVVVVVGAVVAAAAAAGAVLVTRGGGGTMTRVARAAPSVASVAQLCEPIESQGQRDSCYEQGLERYLDEVGHPARTVPKIDLYARASRGYLEQSCHILMHAVGREYASAHHLTLASLQDVLPRSNDPNCSAGFSHGTIIALAPAILRAGSRAAQVACGPVATRYERYSCVHGLGHAYMRMSYESLPAALDECRALGPSVAPDCAQGAFHDYWLSVEGADGTHGQPRPDVSPRSLCGRQRAVFVRPCWYRVYIELPAPVRLGTARALGELCRGLAGIQRSGCVTAGSVVSSTDPFAQARICAALAPADAVSCAHGIRAQALADRPLAVQVRLVRGCAGFPRAARAGCAEWLGKALAVVTNGRFTGPGCGELAGPPGAECTRGGRAFEGPLVTFS